MMIQCTVFAFVLLHVLTSGLNDNFWHNREIFLRQDRSDIIGSNLALNEKEDRVNRILMTEKMKEIDFGYKYPNKFPPAIHFFEAKNLIEQSKVFQIIKKMPKGAVLHIHDSAGISYERFIKIIENQKDLYVCLEKGEPLKFLITNSTDINDTCYKSLDYYRRMNQDDLYNFFLDKLTIYPPLNMTVDEAYPDINAVWRKFQELFVVYGPVLKYRPIFEEFYYQMMQEFFDDNVQYIEARTGLRELYDFDVKEYNTTEVTEIMQHVVNKFKRDHPGFEFKLIYAKHRLMSEENLSDELRMIQFLKKKYPNFFVGFDLVGQEDLGKPLRDFANEILTQTQTLKFFFHAGETNWNGLPSDENIIDAILLNTSRIAHGYSITKHPKALEEVFNRKIGLEICPISNQVLKLVSDLRNHPATILFALGFPVIISCDDPLMWASKGLSYDFYEAFMGFARADADLKTLKQLVLNSIVYSGLEEKDKRSVAKIWFDKWDDFLNDIISNFNDDRTNYDTTD